MKKHGLRVEVPANWILMTGEEIQAWADERARQRGEPSHAERMQALGEAAAMKREKAFLDAFMKS